MERSIVETDHDLKELTEHGTPAFPIMISNGLTLTPDMGIVSWHWHEDLELTYVISGHLEFSVGADSLILNPSEAIFINSKILHQVKPLKKEQPVYYSYAFSSDLITGTMHSLIAQRYLYPLMHNSGFPYYVFSGQAAWEQNSLSHIRALNQAADSHSFSREFQILHGLQAVFIDLIENLPVCRETEPPANGENYSMIKIMLFIKENYAESITLADLAASANISKAGCNRLFHKLLKMTPFEYLLDFRLSQSMRLLRYSSQTVSDIAYSCGFRDISYFCKLFREKNQMSPLAYRKSASA